MPFALPGPRDLLNTVGGVARWSADTAELVVALPGRVTTLLDDVEQLMARIDKVADAADSVVARAGAVADGAQHVVATASDASNTAQELIGLYEPLAVQAAPLAKRFVDELSEDEIHAAITLIDHLPELTDRMTALMPILATLDTVSPEIHELLDVVKDVRQAIQGVPGFRFFRKRGETKDDDEA